MTEIPLIDLSARDEHATAAAIDAACREVGFFTVCGHGVDRQVFADAYAASRAFFDQPFERKTTVRLDTGFTRAPDDYTPYGYSGLLEENAYAYMGERDRPADYVEKFSVGRLILDDAERLPFPDGDAGRELRRALKRYFEGCQQVAAAITELLTLAIGLPRDFFAIRTGRSDDSLRTQLYPGRSGELANDQGMGAHTDGTLVTLLTQNGPGIEVATRSGEWVTPEPPDIDCFIVNIGDLMARWSNDVYVSTPHRVVLRDRARQSIVFFKLANDDTVVECFPAFCEGRPAAYAPILYKTFSLEKMSALFGAET